MADVLFQSNVHGKLTLKRNKDGSTERYINTKKRVNSSRPFQADSSGTGIGGARRRSKIDRMVDDAS